MARYVGKIFKIDNSSLKVRGTGVHYVHVKWYNPLKKNFCCKVITSLEHKLKVSDNKRIKNVPHRFSRGQCYVFSKQKYKRLRDGKITPIPMNQTNGFDLWCGYEDTRYLTIKDLKGNEQENMKIKKKKAR